METIMCRNALQFLMEKWTRTASLMLVFAFMFTIFVPMAFIPVQAQLDTTAPQITDMSTGNPVTGGEYTIIVSAVDDVGINFVRLYYYFIVPSGITSPAYSIMDLTGSQQYQSLVKVPQNASALRYNIYAYDTSNNTSISDVLSKDVIDNQDPVAMCPVNVFLNMGDNYTFNGSASTDNAKIANYTWSFFYSSGTVLLFGSSPVFRFQLPGMYDGSLTVKDPWGNSNALAFHIGVNDTEKPAADAGIQLFVMAGNITFLDGSDSTDNVGIVNYSWTFIHNGTAVKLYGASPSYLFWTAGVYEVRLTVTDAAGNNDTAFLPVQVLDPAPVSSGLPWWTYALIVMILVIVIMAIVIIRI
jgi:hypothetical protein